MITEGGDQPFIAKPKRDIRRWWSRGADDPRRDGWWGASALICNDYFSMAACVGGTGINSVIALEYFGCQ
jgi:hypothetical protein